LGFDEPDMLVTIFQVWTMHNGCSIVRLWQARYFLWVKINKKLMTQHHFLHSMTIKNLTNNEVVGHCIFDPLRETSGRGRLV
jgi:hypothetical protein